MLKPVVIIAIAVVCSVVAVLGVLVALELYAQSLVDQALQQQADYEKKIDGLVKRADGCYSYSSYADRRTCLQTVRDDLFYHLRDGGEPQMYESYIYAYPQFCFQNPNVFIVECD